MKKAALVNIKESLPFFISTLGDYLKSIVSLEDKKQIIENATGSIGFLIQLFGKPLIDHYYDNLSENRLKDYGFYTYCKAAFIQANKSLEYLKGSLKEDLPLTEAALGLEKEFLNNLTNFQKQITIYVFQPKYHPGIQMIKSMVIQMLEKLVNDKPTINIFKKHFNENIEGTVEETFSTDYPTHKANIKQLLFLERETKLLIDIINNSKIGFVENENLKYEEAYGAWLPTSNRNPFSKNLEQSEIQKFEKTLKTVESLIEEYFSVDFENHLDKILFIVADFGKGKSVFLKKYAATIARNYLETGEGYFPIYFNLRSFSKYNRSDSPLGVIDDYLQTEYGIKITSEAFISKRYIFLIDSLDESCDLTHSSVEKVINSVRKIQNLERSLYRINKIVITTRPFDDVLFNLINHNKPFTIKNEKDRDVAHYLSLYGFKKEQFNDWIFNTLRSVFHELDINSSHGFVSEIFEALSSNRQTDIYSILLKNRTLSSSELRRPIFAYMIYQLIKNNINITKVGKIGIYLSFLNLLSKEAKYINDPNLQISLQEQFEARSILHHIAALWLFERQQGKQGSLKKADICRMIGSFGANDSDEEVLKQFKKSGGSDIQFLSHSYFGENDNMLHFQHQSFAEILLAEYYLKVLIKCALDRPLDLEFLISKLKIGIPTDQTIEFFTELLSLLKETISDTITPELKEKRRLLTPLLASIAIDKNNKSLNSPKLFYQWYETGNIEKETNEIPDVLLMNWCVDRNMINGIIDIAEKIINNKKVYLLSKSNHLTPLIDEEVTYLLNYNYQSTLHIEKYLALVVGDVLFNCDNNFFIRRFSFEKTVDLLKNANYEWAKTSFKGILLKSDIREDDYSGRDIVGRISLTSFDLSDAIFEDIVFFDCMFTNCNFRNSTFKNVMFLGSNLRHCFTRFLKVEGIFDIVGCSFEDYWFIPNNLTIKALSNSYSRLKETYFRYRGFHGTSAPIQNVIRFRTMEGMESFFQTTSFYFHYCLKNKYLTETDIHDSFPSRSLKYKEKLKAIINEIATKGHYISQRRPNTFKYRE